MWHHTETPPPVNRMNDWQMPVKTLPCPKLSILMPRRVPLSSKIHRGVALDTVVDSKWDNWSIFDDNGTRRGTKSDFFMLSKQFSSRTSWSVEFEFGAVLIYSRPLIWLVCLYVNVWMETQLIDTGLSSNLSDDVIIWKTSPLISSQVSPLKQFQIKTLPGVSQFNFFHQMKNPPPNWRKLLHWYCDTKSDCPIFFTGAHFYKIIFSP